VALLMWRKACEPDGKKELLKGGGDLAETSGERGATQGNDGVEKKELRIGEEADELGKNTSRGKPMLRSNILCKLGSEVRGEHLSGQKKTGEYTWEDISRRKKVEKKDESRRSAPKREGKGG